MRHSKVIIIGIIAAPVLILLLYICVFAETITLKSGKILDAKIIEETADYIKIDYNNMPVYYERKAIKGIEKSEEGPIAVGSNEETAAVDSGDKDSAAFLRNGLELASQGKFEESEKKLRQGLKLAGSDENISGALSIIDELKNNGLSRELAMNLFRGSYYLMNGDHRRAAIYLGKCHRMQKDDPDICYNLGIAYSWMNNYPASMHYLKKAVAARPEDAEACMILGSICYSAGRYNEAKEYLQLARQLMQKNPAQQDINKIESLLKELP